MAHMKRLAAMVVTLWMVVTLTFLLMHFIPGDPFSMDSKAMPPETIENMRAKYHLDEPLLVQYGHYLKDLAQLDLGPSIQSKTRDVNELIASGFGPSAWLGAQALVLAIVGGIVIGMLAAWQQQKWLDIALMVIAIFGISVPSFILAPLLIQWFAMDLQLVPVASWGTWQHTILPSVALAISPMAVIARFIRARMIEVFHESYMLTAKAKGLNAWEILLRHGLRNAILPILSFIGPLFAGVMTGTFVIEKIFAIPGLGKYYVESIFNRDYPVIMGTTVFYSALLIVTMYIIDLLYPLVDPRIRLNGRKSS